MLAVRSPRYGPADRLQIGSVPRPEVGPEELLVRVQAASINPYDWHLMRGDPYVVRLLVGLRRPKDGGKLGGDVAGIVEAVGSSASGFEPGDRVFGSCSGAFAEYAVARPASMVPMPAGLGFQEAAALPGAGVTALQAVRDHGAVQPGQDVLIIGASGGVGTFAVQIAKAFGAHVTAVCSTRNVELVRSIGADDVLDYTQTDLTTPRRYHVVVDNVGAEPLSTLRRMLAPGGTLVAVAGGSGGRFVGGLARKLEVKLLDRLVDERLVTFIASVTAADLTALEQLVEDGRLTPIIDRVFPLAEAGTAIRYVETGHARGKVILLPSGSRT